MTAQFKEFSISDVLLAAGETATLKIVFKNPVIDLDINDFNSEGVTLSDFQQSNDGTTYTMKVRPNEAYNGKASIELFAGGYISLNDFETGDGNIVKFSVDTITPLPPLINFQDPGSDGLYGANEISSGGTITVTVTVPEGTKVDDTLIINDDAFKVTQVIIDNGQAVEVIPGTEVSASIIDAAGNTSLITTEKAPAASNEPNIPNVPTISFESTGDDDIYNVDEVGEDKTITAIVTVPEGTKVDDTLIINDEAIKVTQDIIDNGQAIEITPGTKVRASITNAAGNIGPEAINTAPTADTVAPKADTTVLKLNYVTDDNVINADEANSAVTITGQAIGEFSEGDEVTLTVNGTDSMGNVDAEGSFSIDVSGSDLVADTNTNIDASIVATDPAGNQGTIKANKSYNVDTEAPKARLDIDAISEDHIQNAVDREESVAVTGTVAGEFTQGDTVTLTVNGHDYTGDLDADGQFSIDVLGSDLATDRDTSVEGVATVTDAAGNQATILDSQGYTTLTDADPIFLYHLGYDLTQDVGPVNAYGKDGITDHYETSTNNDFVYIGYKGFDEHGNLIRSPWDGDFERDSGDPDKVWEMNTAAGNDFIQLREDQNAYTVTKLGTGDDTYYISGALDAHLGAAQHNADARAHVFGEDGNDTIVVGGNGDGRVTGWGVDGGRIFTGSGSDDVTIYGEMDDGGVIDLGSGDTTYANGYTEAESTDSANAVNSLHITHNLGESSRYDFGIVKGGDGQDNVVIGTTINGVSQVVLGDNDDTLHAQHSGDNSLIDMGTGNDSVEISSDTWDDAQILLGSGDDSMTVGYDLNNSTHVDAGDGDDAVVVGEDIEDRSIVELGAGDDTLEVGKNIENYSSVAMGTGDDSVHVNGRVDDRAKVTTDVGDDVVVVDGVISDYANVDLGSGNNTLEVGNGIHGAATVIAEDGNDVLTVGEDIDGYSKVDLGNGDNNITVAEDIEDRAQITTGTGDDVIIVDRYIEDRSVISTGAGDDLITTEGVNNAAKIDTDTGNDTLIIQSEFGVGGGSAHVLMGEGNDMVTFGGKRLDGVIEGESGNDTLVLTFDSSEALTTGRTHVTNLTSKNFKGFETIELEGHNAIDIRYKDLVNDTDREGALFINGDDNSKVDLGNNNWNSDGESRANLNDGYRDSWSETGSTVVDGVTYSIYHHSQAGNDYSHDVYIQEGITVI